MNTERLYKILDSQISKKSVNKDFDINIGLGNTNKPIPLNDINSEVNQGDVFENERNESECYRFLGSIRQLMSNVLIDITGPDSQDTINQIINQPDSEFSQLNQLLIEDNGWIGYYIEKNSNLCFFVDLNPKKQELLMIKNGVDDNWDLNLTYPYTGISNTLYFNANEDVAYPIYLTDGIALSSVFQTEVGGVSMVGFKTPINHGLRIGDQIKIFGGTIYDGVHNIIQLGDNNGDDDGSNFIINTSATTINIASTNASFKRIVNNVESKYYARYFKTITNSGDIDFYKTSYATTIFEDEVISYNTKNDIDVSKYVDYLGRPITDMYLTIVKRKTKTSSPSPTYWGYLTAGIETKVNLANYDIRQINGVYSIPDLGIVNSTDTTYFGDIIDYNDEDISERILETARHRFNSTNREANSYLEGYFYKPHNKIQIRYYSNYLEYSDPNIPTTNIPYYALYSNGRYRWRDILTKGYIDETGRGADYPFLNGCSYVYNNLFLTVRRQDPKLDYEHINNSIFGISCEDLDQFIIKEKDVC